MHAYFVFSVFSKFYSTFQNGPCYHTTANNKTQRPFFWNASKLRTIRRLSPHLYNIEGNGIQFPATPSNPPKIGSLAHTRGVYWM